MTKNALRNKLKNPFMLVTAGVLLLYSILIRGSGISINPILFIIAGIFHGIYYGLNNHEIFHHNNSDKRSKESKIHELWIHLLCSIAGSLALYFLLTQICYSNRLNVFIFKNLNFSTLILFLISLLGLAGLLPMTLWFFARSGDILASLIKKQ